MGNFGSSVTKIGKSLIKQTFIGRKLSEIRTIALECKRIPLEVKTADVKDIFVSTISSNINNGKKIYSSLLDDKSFISSLQTYVNKLHIEIPNLAKTGEDGILKIILELGTVGPSKFLQIISSDESIINQLPSKIKKVIEQTTSNNKPTRSLEEAQKEISEMFSGKYSVIERSGTGTIGEGYWVQDKSGKKYVAKLIKKGVDTNFLDAEEEIFTKVLRQILPDTPKSEQKIKTLKGMYKDWKNEVNYVIEAKYNKMLATGAKRFSVAGVTDLSKDARGIVYTAAEGIQADKFMEMVKLYKKDPNLYFEQYKDIIKKYPAMKSPEKVAKQFALNFMKSFDEMFLFRKKGLQGSMMHGDPHKGNIFVAFDKNGEAKTQFIDTGNCVFRSQKDIKEDLRFLASYFVGGSEEMARYFIKRAESLPKGKSKEQTIQILKEELDSQLFKKGCCVTNFGRNQKLINTIIDDQGILLSNESSTSLKAQLQFLETTQELYHLAKLDKAQIMRNMAPDVLNGIMKLSFSTNTIKIVAPEVKQLRKDPVTGFGTLFQMIG